jgi:hypothetical protein
MAQFTSTRTTGMREIQSAIFLGVCFAFLGGLAADGNIPPLHLLGGYAKIVCGLIGLAVGFWCGRR